MRAGLRHLAPFALVAGLHVACSATDARSPFPANPEQDAGNASSSGNTFDPTVDAGTPDAQGCSETKSEILRVPTVIEFAVDESGSMDSDGKWTAARDALMGAFADMNTAGDPGVFVGLLLWSDGVNDEVDPGAIADASHYSDLVDIIDKPDPGDGGTEMLTAIKAAYKAVENFTAPAGFVKDQVNRAIVFVSDGVPNDDSDKTAVPALAATKFAEQPPKGPILTFSVGIGPFPSPSEYTYSPALMSQIALKGGTGPAGCNPTSPYAADLCHFQVTPSASNTAATKQALVDAINQIRAATISCEFTFTRNENTDLGNVKVEVTDQDGNVSEIPKDDENGWSFDDPENPSKVILHGESCSGASGTVSTQVSVILGCKLTQ
jgi:von Willebrand factor type A domain